MLTAPSIGIPVPIVRRVPLEYAYKMTYPSDTMLLSAAVTPTNTVTGLVTHKTEGLTEETLVVVCMSVMSIGYCCE
jgi:hypothetical protein